MLSQNVHFSESVDWEPLSTVVQAEQRGEDDGGEDETGTTRSDRRSLWTDNSLFALLGTPGKQRHRSARRPKLKFTRSIQGTGAHSISGYSGKRASVCVGHLYVQLSRANSLCIFHNHRGHTLGACAGTVVNTGQQAEHDDVNR